MAKPHRHRCLHGVVLSDGKRTHLVHPSGSSAIHLSGKMKLEVRTFSLTAAWRNFIHTLLWHGSENKSQTQTQICEMQPNINLLLTAFKIQINIDQSRHHTLLETPPTRTDEENKKIKMPKDALHLDVKLRGGITRERTSVWVPCDHFCQSSQPRLPL